MGGKVVWHGKGMEMQVWGVFMEIIQVITMKNTHTKIYLYENYLLGSFHRVMRSLLERKKFVRLGNTQSPFLVGQRRDVLGDEIHGG